MQRKAAADWSVEGPSQKKKEKTDDGKKKVRSGFMRALKGMEN